MSGSLCGIALLDDIGDGAPAAAENPLAQAGRVVWDFFFWTAR